MTCFLCLLRNFHRALTPLPKDGPPWVLVSVGQSSSHRQAAPHSHTSQAQRGSQSPAAGAALRPRLVSLHLSGFDQSWIFSWRASTDSVLCSQRVLLRRLGLFHALNLETHPSSFFNYKENNKFTNIKGEMTCNPTHRDFSFWLLLAQCSFL